MPKIKTKRAASKRFKRTRNGLFIRKRAFKGHLLEGKSYKTKKSIIAKTSRLLGRLSMLKNYACVSLILITNF